MSTDMDYLARLAYELGQDPVTYAEKTTRALIDAHMAVAAARAENPRTFPGYCIPLTTDALAGRIVAWLLDAGWSPPAAAQKPLRAPGEDGATLSEIQTEALAEARKLLDAMQDEAQVYVARARAELGASATADEVTILAGIYARWSA
jgi:hypothetical protein